jgi:hypothetical protein
LAPNRCSSNIDIFNTNSGNFFLFHVTPAISANKVPRYPIGIENINITILKILKYKATLNIIMMYTNPVRIVHITTTHQITFANSHSRFSSSFILPVKLFLCPEK